MDARTRLLYIYCIYTFIHAHTGATMDVAPLPLPLLRPASVAGPAFEPSTAGGLQLHPSLSASLPKLLLLPPKLLPLPPALRPSAALFAPFSIPLLAA